MTQTTKHALFVYLDVDPLVDEMLRIDREDSMNDDDQIDDHLLTLESPSPKRRKKLGVVQD